MDRKRENEKNYEEFLFEVNFSYEIFFCFESIFFSLACLKAAFQIFKINDGMMKKVQF